MLWKLMFFSVCPFVSKILQYQTGNLIFISVIVFNKIKNKISLKHFGFFTER